MNILERTFSMSAAFDRMINATIANDDDAYHAAKAEFRACEAERRREEAEDDKMIRDLFAGGDRQC